MSAIPPSIRSTCQSLLVKSTSIQPEPELGLARRVFLIGAAGVDFAMDDDGPPPSG